MENWKTIEGFDEYEVSDLGRVRRAVAGINTHIGRILKPNTVTNGYRQVRLQRNGKPKNELLHRLVAKAFLPNPSNLPEVNHIHGKHDDAVSNLEWRTTIGNQQHAAQNGLKGEGVYFNKNSQKWRAYYYPTPYKEKHLGYFITKEQALAARNKAVTGMGFIL
jgi:hypothetical protein